MSTMYKMTNHISERITEDPNIASNIKDQDVSGYIIDRKYLQDFEYKLNVCLEYYSKINPNSIPLYLTDDIIAFLHCVYYQNELPTRDYQKLLEIIDSGEV